MPAQVSAYRVFRLSEGNEYVELVPYEMGHDSETTDDTDQMLPNNEDSVEDSSSMFMKPNLSHNLNNSDPVANQTTSSDPPMPDPNQPGMVGIDENSAYEIGNQESLKYELQDNMNGNNEETDNQPSNNLSLIHI